MCQDSREFQSYIAAADLSVRATNVLVQNCSSLEEFNSLSEEILLNFPNCGRKTVREILSFLVTIRSAGVLTSPPSSQEQLALPPKEYSISILPLFSSKKLKGVAVVDLHPDFQAFTKLADLIISTRTANVLYDCDMKIIGDVMLTPGSDLLKRKNFGRKSLNELKGVIRALCLPDNHSDGLNDVDYSSYDEMVASFIGQCVKNKRDQDLFMRRLCFSEGKVPTLEELGQQCDISRERARQILKKGLDKLRVKANLDRLEYFWQQLDHLVVQGGGLIKLGTLPTVLQAEFAWPTAPSPPALGQVLMIRYPNLILASPTDLLKIECNCLACDLPGQQLLSLDFEATDSFHVQVVAARLSEHCQKRCPWHKPVTTFHRAFIERLVDKSDGRLMLHDDVVLPHYRWRGKYCKNLEDVIGHVLESNGEPMHFREIANGIRRKNDNFAEISDHNVHAAIMRYKTIEIIGRGTYGLKSWGLGGYRSVSTAIEELIDEKGLPQRRQDIIHHLQGEFSEQNITASLTVETRFTSIGDGFYDRPQNWQQRSCQGFIKQLPEPVAELAHYLMGRNNTSYKLVMAFIFIRSMDEEGAIYLYKLKDMFYNFYLSRHKKGLVVEIDTAVMSRIGELSPVEIKNKACKEPLKSFLSTEFFQNGAKLRLLESVIFELSKKTTRDLLLITILKAIADYFQKINLSVVVTAPGGTTRYEVAEPRQELHRSEPENELEQHAPTISIKKKGRGKIKL